MKHTLSDIAAKCDEADMVLVGIGEEFQYDWDILLRNERYQEIEKEIEQKEKKREKNIGGLCLLYRKWLWRNIRI